MGSRGIPARYGGFETLAERLSLHLTARGWSVRVYCQAEEADGDHAIRRDTWRGVERVTIAPRLSGAPGTMEFDLRCVRDVITSRAVHDDVTQVDLVLGYNTAVFNLLQRAHGRRVVINMDGIEWRRSKWGPAARAWLWLNERIALRAGSQLIGDHPRIAQRLKTLGRPDTHMIPYGADIIGAVHRDAAQPLEVMRDGYFLFVARIEPENGLLEILRAHAASQVPQRCVVVGQLHAGNAYHDRVRAAARADTIFAGAIYEAAPLAALRAQCRAYLHGHSVGGTNPTLVEALGAGNAVLAHDNPFNRWTAGPEQLFYGDDDTCRDMFRRLDRDTAKRDAMRAAARARHAETFGWGAVLSAYEALLEND